MQRPWYDIALICYIGLAAGLEFIILQKTSRQAWAVAIKGLGIFVVFAYAFTSVFYPHLLDTPAGPICRAFLAVAITWEIGELVYIGWTILTGDDYTEDERRAAALNMVTALVVLLLIVALLVIAARPIGIAGAAGE